MKILVHLHLYYTDMLPEMINYLRSLGDKDYDLYVTTTEDNNQINEAIFAFKKDARVLIVPNKGYDLAPFLKVMQSVDLNRYDYVIKLHTKRNLPKPVYLSACRFREAEWRDCLMGFMENRHTLEKSLAQFQKNSKVGMLSHHKLIIKAGKEDQEASRRAQEIMKQLGLPLKQLRFVAGTMFICRAELMKPLQQLPYSADDFDEPLANHRGGTLAHAMERVLGWLVENQGYKIASYVPYTSKTLLEMLAYKCGRFIYQNHTNSKGVTHIKICKIPVYKHRP